VIEFAVSVLTPIRMAFVRFFVWNPFIKATHNPQAQQNKLLIKILERNQKTVYGKEYGFEKLSSYSEFKASVPVNSYDDLEEYVDRQDVERRPYLTTEPPIMYVLTSGTTGKSKKIPIQKSGISHYQQSQQLLAYAMYRDIPQAYKGKILAIVSPSHEGFLESGSSYGSMSGLIYQSMPRMLRTKYVVPPEVFELEDYNEKYLAIAKAALSEKNISLIATANPTSLLKLNQVINENTSLLISAISQSNRKRASELESLLARKGALKFSDLWPTLEVITVWTGGSCGIPIARLKEWLPLNTAIVEVGYMSSEFRGGVTIDVLNNKQLPTFQHNFFEFVKKEDWEAGSTCFLTLDQLSVGVQYYVFVTTQAGLYRYNINDIIEVTGFINATPTIQFVQKGRGITNITGEKLSEAQLLLAVREFCSENNIFVEFFVLVAYPEQYEYCLYLELPKIDASDIEKKLRKMNIEFEDKLKSGRLKPLTYIFLKPGAGEHYKEHCLSHGQREGQFKLIHIQYHDDCSFDFLAHERNGS